MINERLYKVGFYRSKVVAGKVVTTDEKVYQDNLKPMTHKQACTFKSKMMNPNNHFLYECEV